MATFASSSSTVNLSNGPDPQCCTPVSTGGWQDARIDLLEALGHLGHLVEATRALFGPGVAAPLREALSDVRGLELGLVDAVIDAEGRFRSEVAEVRQHLNRTQAALTDTQDRVNVTLTRLTAAVIEEANRARRGNRPLASWAVEAINESHVAARHILGERIWWWLLDCEAAGEGWMSMNPCPHPVESAQRAARDLTMAWARNLTLIDADQASVITLQQREVRRAAVPSPEEMAAKYIEVRDQILASPPPRPPAPGGDR